MDDVKQGSPEWYRARIGQLGASRITAALSKGKGSAESSTRRNLIAELVSMRLTGVSPEGFTSASMQWGTDNEPLARSAYEVAQRVFVDQCSFVPHPSIEWTGASPDGLINHDGLVEIKCPNTANHIDYMLSGSPPAEYKNQMLWQMECTGRDWCDFVSFDPRMPDELQLFVVRYNRDDDRLNEIRGGVKLFLDDVAGLIVKLNELKVK